MNGKPNELAWLFLFWVFIAGCSQNRYEIELVPNGDTIERTLSCERRQSTGQETTVVDFPTDELKVFAEAYDAEFPADLSATHRFTKQFDGRLPDDIGGHGTYTHWQTSLGSMSAYVERFRGDDDLLTDINGRMSAIDRLSDLMTEWLRSELDETDAKSLITFVDGQLRHDLKNICLQAWIMRARSTDTQEVLSDSLIGVGQYLMERDYFAPESLPEFVRAFDEAQSGDSTRLQKTVQRMVARKLGLSPDSDSSGLDFMLDEDRVVASLSATLAKSDEYVQMLQEWEAERKENPEEEKPKPIAVLAYLMHTALPIGHIFGQEDRLTVRLVSPSRPVLTNGQWDEDSSHVRWSHSMLPRDSELTQLPNILYAFWAETDSNAQRDLFGKTVISGESLVEYCLWYKGLSPEESDRWDEFLSTLKPSSALNRLKAFRFDEAATDDDDLAARPRQLLTEQLE